MFYSFTKMVQHYYEMNFFQKSPHGGVKKRQEERKLFSEVDILPDSVGFQRTRVPDIPQGFLAFFVFSLSLRDS